MIYDDFKKLLLEKHNILSEEEKKRFDVELRKAKIAYDNKIDLLQELTANKDKISNRYVIPFLLGLTNSLDISKPVELKQAKLGAGGKSLTASCYSNIV